jgi:hypothetical protein
MKLYKEVLAPITLSVIHREFTNLLETDHAWTCSSFKWKPDIKVNISGATMVAKVNDGIASMILEDLGDKIPSMKSKRIQYCAWLPNSGISTHNDGMYTFGATIYLNETWDINDGGIFMYEYADNDWRGHIPTFNTMTVNDTKSLHLVTPVSPFAKHNRYTIQIFGDIENG